MKTSGIPFGSTSVEMEQHFDGKTLTLCGETLYFMFGAYPNGRLAISFTNFDGEPWGTLTVNVVEAPEPDKDEIIVKTWSENEALAEAALESGLFIDTGVRYKVGYVEASLWKIR